MNTLKEFMNTDTINTSSLSGNYIIRTDSTTGIDTLTVAGEEGFHSQMMITDSEQLQKLQDLADVYKQKYPNVVTSSEAALNFARGEVLGFNFQTPNGIMIANQTGMIYMDDKNPDNDWVFLMISPPTLTTKSSSCFRKMHLITSKASMTGNSGLRITISPTTRC